MNVSGGWDPMLHAWANHMKAGGLRDSTIAQRLYHLGRVAREIDGRPAEVSTEALQAWLAGQSWSPNTLRSYRASLRVFYRWAVMTRRVTLSPADELPPVKVPRAMPRPTPEAAFKEAIARADDRTRLAILLAGICGLRRGEIAQVRRDDVVRDLTGWSLRVVGKGGHERLVPMTDGLAAIVRARPSGWLFPSTHGGHLTPHHLGKIVSACLPGDLTTHTLRHRCGTVAYAATKDLRAVQELLGHSKPETTAIYTMVPPESIRKAMEGAA